MSIKIEEGKFYRTRDGRKVGPMTIDGRGHAYVGSTLADHEWLPDGNHAGIIGMTSKDDLIAEWVDEPAAPVTEPAAPKLWRDMDPAEKGALLLAHHEGKVIQEYVIGRTVGWFDIITGHAWDGFRAYRVKPQPAQPKEIWVVHGGPYLPTIHMSLEEAKKHADSCGFGSSVRHFREVV